MIDVRFEDRENIIQNMQEIVNSIPSKYYSDILFDTTSSLTVSKSRSGEKVNANLKTRGFVFRIYNGERYYELSTAATGISKLKENVAKLLSNIEKKSTIELVSYPKHEIDRDVPMNIDFTQMALSDKLSKINNVYDTLKKIDDRVQNSVIRYQDSIQERIFVNTEGSILRQKIPRISTYLAPLVKVDGRSDSDYHFVSGQGGFEVLNAINHALLSDLVKSSIELAQAPLPPTGKMPVVLDPSVSGFLSHAVFGHGVQGDAIYEERSVWKNHYQKQVASEILSITDKPIDGIYGNYFFDDEGVLCQKTPLIEKGILKNFLHSRMTASLLGMEGDLHGNGRRQSFMHPIFPRNSNTFIEPGDYDIDEIISEMEYGLLLVKASHGLEDFDGSIHCNSKSGYVIENGEIKDRVKGISLSGDAINMLMAVDAVSKGPVDFIGMNSRKGLNEMVPISFGGVYIRSTNGFVSPG
ncbi:hypothetical protein NEF87_004482 [Candidatus Lokiarchaeum ossiferum]|uniref:TldD/PmbA family protein n=1 Tax=Candidatus Lokiarchaeum ossiferum TaxID=2951803 RepID=A0ABY6HXE4_9ARCH|nr:hypothetical protein NEF87_004482 [Candidatus Lokiarchaeum sp. B-35]